MPSTADPVWSLRAGMRRLWADHAIWTRQYIIAAVADTPDAEHAAARQAATSASQLPSRRATASSTRSSPRC